MAGIGDIAMSSNFELSSQRPLDARKTQVDVTARDAIALVKRYDGLEIYVEDGSRQTYRLALGTVDTDLTNNLNWIDTTFIVGETNISDLVNDLDYVSIGDNVSVLVNDSSYVVTGANISVFVNDSGYLTSFTEVDPIFTASPAFGITAGDIITWDTASSQATEIALGLAMLATQPKTDTGTDDLTIVTPLKLRTTVFVPSQIPQATKTAIGGSELADQAEVDAGTDIELIVTPSTLAGRLAHGAWQTPTLTSWTNIDLQYRLLSNGFVQLFGSATSFTNSNLFSLPVGYRPTRQVEDTLTYGLAELVQGMRVDTDGLVYISVPSSGDIFYFNIIFPRD